MFSMVSPEPNTPRRFSVNIYHIKASLALPSASFDFSLSSTQWHDVQGLERPCWLGELDTGVEGDQASAGAAAPHSCQLSPLMLDLSTFQAMQTIQILHDFKILVTTLKKKKTLWDAKKNHIPHLWAGARQRAATCQSLLESRWTKSVIYQPGCPIHRRSEVSCGLA